MVGEVFEVYNMTVFAGKIAKFPPAGSADKMVTTFKYILFKNKVEGLAVQGLYGYTSVAMVPQRGAWASHIWEPGFRSGDKKSRQRAIDEVHEVRGAGDDLPPFGFNDVRLPTAIFHRGTGWRSSWSAAK